MITRLEEQNASLQAEIQQEQDRIEQLMNESENAQLKRSMESSEALSRLNQKEKEHEENINLIKSLQQSIADLIATNQALQQTSDQQAANLQQL